MYAKKFCDAGQVPIFRYFEACLVDLDLLYGKVKLYAKNVEIVIFFILDC